MTKSGGLQGVAMELRCYRTGNKPLHIVCWGLCGGMERIKNEERGMHDEGLVVDTKRSHGDRTGQDSH